MRRVGLRNLHGWSVGEDDSGRGESVRRTEVARICCHVFVLVVHTHVNGQTSVGGSPFVHLRRRALVPGHFADRTRTFLLVETPPN